MKIETKSGFTCEIDKDVIESWDFVKAIALCENEETAMSGIVGLELALLGKSGAKALEKHLKKVNGTCSASAMYAEFEDIMGQLNEGNSLSSQA